MSDGGAGLGDRDTLGAVARARARLRRIAGRTAVRARARWIVGAGAVIAVIAALALRLGDASPRWMAPARSAAAFAIGTIVAAVVIAMFGRRRGPSDVTAARAIDEALGLEEIVASGFAFARDGRDEPLALLARRRAGEAVKDVRVDRIFALPSVWPARRTAGRLAIAAALAVAVGSYDRGLVLALVSPPTQSETEAATELEDVASDLEAEAKNAARSIDRPAPGREKGDDKGGERGPALAETARAAARAARRGDRKGALDKLDALRGAGEKQAARADGIGAALRRIAEALGPSGKSGKGGAQGDAQASKANAGAEASMRLLAKKLREAENANAAGGEESKERMLERLERAGDEARRAAAAGNDASTSEAARALSRAAEALRRGDREAAAAELERAAERAAAMASAREAAAAEAMMVAELLERSGALERAIQMAMLGRESAGEPHGAGEGGDRAEGGAPGGKASGGAGSALRSAILARLAAMGAPPPDGDPGTGSGPHVPDRRRARREALAASGSLRAPSEVTEGARAIQAIQGLGRGTEPPASYREVFPSYDAAAEEGLADERVPAARRAAVRRYFQSIRPDQPFHDGAASGPMPRAPAEP